MKKQLNGFAEHIQYLFTLNERARRRHPDYINMINILKQQGCWKRSHKINPFLKKKLVEYMKNINKLKKHKDNGE